MNTTEIAALVTEKAAHQFGTGPVTIEPLGEGLIHRTYKVHYLSSGTTAVLQCINQHTFPQPENIIHNYRLLQNILNMAAEPFRIPALLLTTTGKLFWVDETDNFWRATEYIHGCYTASVPADRHHAKSAASCFALFVKALEGADPFTFNIVIPSFHDLSHRNAQLEKAIGSAAINRLMKATHVIAEVRQRKVLVQFYENMKLDESFRLRLMHHDCKISNVLFDSATREVVCPVDLDTTMPGYFFSDAGDLVRTMACTEDENSVLWEKIAVRKEIYADIIEGYTAGVGKFFTPAELHHLHHAGLMMVYMQCTRFLTDFLNNDIYYRTTYPEQNLNRALNQLILLEKLESLLDSEYNYHPYS